MVSAELSHNPFLLETEARFNGHGPQVNCAISKFEDQPLASWASEVPRIFHDEMNGYGFDLFFSGTDADFARVVQAFRDARVPEDSVRVLRKGSLQAADQKLRDLRELIDWLEQHPNDRLDFRSLVDYRPELIDATFPLLLLHGNEANVRMPSVSAELVNDIDELKDFDLRNIPVIAFVTPDTFARIRGEIVQLVARDDVILGQLFFAIHPMLDKDKVVRTISDLGVPNPQVVVSPDDPAITMYLLAHPVTEYVRKSTRILSAEAERVAAELEEASEKTALSSAAGEQRVGEYDSEIALLKESDERLTRLTPPGAPREFFERARMFRESMSRWNGRRKRIEGERDARAAADDLGRCARHYLADFVLGIDYAARDARKQIDEELADAYAAAGIDDSYRPSFERPRVLDAPVFPEIEDEVLGLKETVLVEQRNDFFGLFSGGAEESEKVPITIYNVDEWRARALDLLEPCLDNLLVSRGESLKRYQSSAVESYRAHIAELVKERRARKEETLAKMSNEDRALQAENEWLASYRGMLQKIKRG